MARYPGADWRPLPENATQPPIHPTQVILHTAACRCGDSLQDDFNRKGNTLESHFFVQLDGGVEQYIDTEIQADANYQANRRAISIETEDGGEVIPWTPAQMDALTALLAWILVTHPAVAHGAPPSWSAPGVGYHSQFRQWSPTVKSCPNPMRKLQYPAVVWRAVDQVDNPAAPQDWEATWVPPAGLGQVAFDDLTIPRGYKYGFPDYPSWLAQYPNG